MYFGLLICSDSFVNFPNPDQQVGIVLILAHFWMLVLPRKDYKFVEPLSGQLDESKVPKSSLHNCGLPGKDFQVYAWQLARLQRGKSLAVFTLRRDQHKVYSVPKKKGGQSYL
ncbi:uncharacterized protein LOC124416219 [Diprion similis]|uniref:uncharacterized protein LOC124416219 n=1 Tax=Diprion similis TaxID=362088 RepID=UPI001EF9800F|nr:uncharacterized protein LOC124416219 [Diprion similis]